MRKTLAVLALLALVGCVRPGEKAAERAVEELLPQYLGPAQSYKAHVKAASLGGLMRGRVRTVTIVGRGVQLLPECTVAELRVDAAEIEVDKRSQFLKSVGQARFEARIEEKELDRLVRARRPKLVDLQIGLRGSFVSIRATPEIFGYPTVPLQVEGNLLPRGGGVTMDFEPDKARLLIIPIPKPVLDYVAEQLNPVVDFSTLRAPIRVEKAEIKGGSLLLSGYLPPERVNGLGVQRGSR